MTSIGDETVASATDQPIQGEPLRGVIDTLLEELQRGSGDKDKRRQVEEWMRNLAEKYPDFPILPGLREYYLAEADRLRSDFDGAGDLTEKLNLGRMIESFLEKAADMDRRIQEKG
ncbi:MAG TPA: hypothetical protein VMS12_03230 [Thermoanaerobaculia bacterium]|nr:hypothetical protein [Thermoanaerobaculia bacterium]